MDISVFDIFYQPMNKQQKSFVTRIFNDLNQNVFDNKLDKPTYLGLLNNSDWLGLTVARAHEGERKSKNGVTPVTSIILSPWFMNVEQLKHTVAHEFIHLFQAQNTLSLAHNSLFKHYQAEIAYHYGVVQNAI